jgi:hypothetical protein
MLDHLHPAGQRIRQRAQSQHPGRSGQEVATRGWVEVDSHLDRPKQLGNELDLVYDHQAVVVDEVGRVVVRGP